MKFNILIIILTAVQILMVSTGFAQSPPAASPPAAAPTASSATNPFAGFASSEKEKQERLNWARSECSKEEVLKEFDTKMSCLRALGAGDFTADPRKSLCDTETANFKKAWNEFQTACGSTTFIGTSTSCRENIKECFEAQSEEDYEDRSKMVSSIMNKLGVKSEKDLIKKCPTMNIKDWKSEHKDLEDSINSLNEKMHTAQETRNKIQKEQSESFEKLNEKYNELLKSQKQQQLKSKSEKREALLKKQEEVAKAQKSISEIERGVRSQEANITSLYYEKAAKLVSASDAFALGNFQCSTQLEKQLKDMPKVTAKSYNSLSKSGGSSYSSRSAALKACIHAFQIGRQKEIAQFNAKLASEKKELEDMKVNLQAAREMLNTAKSNQDEAFKDLQQSDKDALESFNADVLAIQQKMQNISQSSKNEYDTISQRIQTLQQQITSKTNSFANLGAKPKGGSNETFETSTSKYQTAQSAFNDAVAKCGDCKAKGNEFLGRSQFCKKPETQNESLGTDEETTQ